MGFLLQFLATKAIAPILGSIVLLTMGEHPVSLSNPRVVIRSDTLYISTNVQNGFTKELKKIIKSGVIVTFRLKVKTEDEIYFVHKVYYDIEKRIYEIKREEAKGESKIITTEDEKRMIDLASEFSNVCVPCEKFPSSKKIEIRVSLDPVKLDFLEGEEFDMMALWEYRSPKQTVSIKE
jgi:hypothetical protein